MKKFVCRALLGLLPVMIAMIAPVFPVSATLDYPFGESETILTSNEGDVVGSAITDSDDPLRDGTKLIGQPIGDSEDGDSIYFDGEIDSTQSAWEKGTRFVKALLNWALGVIGLVALVYLIYHGILAVTARTDDDQYKKGMDGVRFAFIAIMGIAVSWFIISLVFWLINLLTG